MVMAASTDVLIKRYFRISYNNKEILSLLAHKHGAVISIRTQKTLWETWFVQEDKPYKLGGGGRIHTKLNRWNGADAGVTMVAPACDPERVCCITRYNRATDQVV